uniref:Uncharacterized protein n=1 Tax=Oryza glumipatula TaxID=40148 RepID=A0A0E0A7Z0_9ORYZ
MYQTISTTYRVMLARYYVIPVRYQTISTMYRVILVRYRMIPSKYQVIPTRYSWASRWGRSTSTRAVGLLQPSPVNEDGDGGGRGRAQQRWGMATAASEQESRCGGGAIPLEGRGTRRRFWILLLPPHFKRHLPRPPRRRSSCRRSCEAIERTVEDDEAGLASEAVTKP